MALVTLKQKVWLILPEIYEGSYEDIFRNIDFNFSIFLNSELENEVGRPGYPNNAMFGALILKELKLNSSFRTIEKILKKNHELAELIGFNPYSTPSDSSLRRFFAEVKLEDIYTVNEYLLNELRAFGYAKGEIVGLDSTPIEAYCKWPTKKRKISKDKDAKWGFSKCKGGWYFGYKAQIMFDAEDELPIFPITTPANVSDQKMITPFIEPLKKMGYKPKIGLLDAGYDSEDNHRLLREELGCISLIYPNERGKEKVYSNKMKKYYKKLMYQTTLDQFIPEKKRKREYRKCSLVLKKEKIFKKYYNMRVSNEHGNSALKRSLFIEMHNLMGLKNMEKHVALKCLCILVVALTALRMGVPEAIRSLKYFQ